MADDWNDWKEGELSYIKDLVTDGGNKSVPEDGVPDYLQMQSVSARKDGQIGLAAILDYVRVLWDSNRRDIAVRVLKGVVFGKENFEKGEVTI